MSSDGRLRLRREDGSLWVLDGRVWVPVDQAGFDVTRALLAAFPGSRVVGADASLDPLEAKTTRRPCGGGWMRSKSTGEVIVKTCKSWLCSSCNLWLRIGAQVRIVKGAIDRPDGQSVGFFTFTEPARATLDLPGLYRRWEATKHRLRRRGWLSEYALAVELQKRGALHVHVIGWVPDELAGRLRPWNASKRDRVQYRWHFGELVPMARDLGWGSMVDAAAAENFAELGSYAAKSLAGYTTKDAHRHLKRAGAKRVRPVRFSHGWTEQGLRAFQRGATVKQGPWEDVSLNGPCGASCAA